MEATQAPGKVPGTHLYCFWWRGLLALRGAFLKQFSSSLGAQPMWRFPFLGPGTRPLNKPPILPIPPLMLGAPCR